MSEKLIILTDLGSFKAFRLTRDELTQKPHLRLVENFEPVDGHLKLQDKVTDQAGRFPVSNGSAAGPMSHGENHNLQSEIQRRVIKFLSDSINEIVNREGTDYWYFAAHREIDQKILDGVEPGIRSKLQKHVRSDLTKVDKSELLSYFA
jgi:hypothetical protein